MNTYYRSHVDDRALALTHHDGRASVDKVESRLQVYANHSVPLLFGHAEHQTVLRNAGIVYQHVDRTEVFMHLLHHLGSLSKVSSIRSVSKTLHALSFDFLTSSFAVFVNYQISESNVSAFFCEFQRDSLADTTGSTRYQGSFTS